MARKQQEKPEVSSPSLDDFSLEIVNISDLKPHPRNYREHPEDQLEHIKQSLDENGIYRNVVIAQDNTILAGHGVIEAALQRGLKVFPAKRLPYAPDDPRALKVLIGDNETPKRAFDDDRALTEMLKELHSWDPDALLGTGFDAQMMAALAFVTRPASEIKDKDEAAHWAGMPEYENPDEPLKLVMNFRNEMDRQDFITLLGLEFVDSKGKTLSAWYPPKMHEDTASLRFDGQ